MARPDFSPQPTLLEIVFETRNKAYGAYQLRREYPQILSKALLIGLLLIGGLLAFTALSAAIRSRTDVDKPDVTTEIEITKKSDTKTEKPAPKLEIPKSSAKPATARLTIKLTQFLLKPDETAKPDTVWAPSQIPENAVIGVVTNLGGTPDLSYITDEGDLDETQVESRAIVGNIYETFDIQKMPSFPGGDAERIRFLKENIRYPATAREIKIEGTVALRFIVQEDGSITNIEVLKDPGGGLGKEAIRVVRNMPKWTPGEANGHPVKVKFTMPIRFRLE